MNFVFVANRHNQFIYENNTPNEDSFVDAIVYDVFIHDCANYLVTIDHYEALYVRVCERVLHA